MKKIILGICVVLTISTLNNTIAINNHKKEEDVFLIVNSYLENIELTEKQRLDFNKDGKITLADAVIRKGN